MKIIRKIFQGRNYKTFFIVLAVMAIIGHMLNKICPHRHFYFNQYLLFIMLTIQLFVLKKIDMENLAIAKELNSIKEIEVWGSFNTKTMKWVHTTKSKLVSIILVLIYIFAMFKVGCLELTITGIYGGILGALVFYIGIQAYFRYLILLYFSWDLKNLQIKKYFFYIPALTEWMVLLAKEFSYIEKRFLVLGFMYSSIYAFNIPSGTIVIDHGILIQSLSNFWLFITWIGIIVFFAIAVPTFTFLSRHFIKECIGRCKCISIKALEAQIRTLLQAASEQDLNVLQIKLSLIREISLSEEYPLKYKYTIFDNVYTVCIALLTLISPFASIIEQLIIQR